MTAAEHFHAELNALIDAGEGAPCLDHAGGNLWISDARDARQAAAWRCLPCPLLDACHDMADELKADAGVWAAIDHNVPRAKRRRIDYEETR